MRSIANVVVANTVPKFISERAKIGNDYDSNPEIEFFNPP